MARFVQEAVARLSAYLAANLPAQLRVVETAEGLAVGDLTDPVEVVAAETPSDNRSPLVLVFDDGFAFPEAGQRHDLLYTTCTVALMINLDADVSANALFARRYLTALIETLTAAPTLGGTVVAAILTDGDKVVLGDESATRIVYALGVEVHTHTV